MSGPFDLGGRVAVVVGASGGLGKEAATTMAEAGADLLIAARNARNLAAAAEEIANATGRIAAPIVTDVTDRVSVGSMVQAAIDRFGRIDVLMNCAGVNVRAPVEKVRDEDFHRIQQVNVYGTFCCCRAVVPHMVKAGFGRIINVGSALSMIGLPERVSYSASKGAVLQITRTLAVELARTGVTVNCICPGPFATEINRPLLENPQAARFVLDRVPMNRWGELGEIRTAVLFLASPASSYVTGAAVPVDGGWTAQ